MEEIGRGLGVLLPPLIEAHRRKGTFGVPLVTRICRYPAELKSAMMIETAQGRRVVVMS